MKRRIPALVVLCVVLAGCASDSTSGPDATASPPASASATQAPPAVPGVTVAGDLGEEPVVTLADDFGPVDALAVVDIADGQGEPVAAGALLSVHYVGVGEQSRDVFDSSWAAGQPVDFPLAGVIQGWQEGLIGMRPGGRRLLVIPGSLAYGPDGYPPVIGPDETLVFVVDLIEATPAAS